MGLACILLANALKTPPPPPPRPPPVLPPPRPPPLLPSQQGITRHGIVDWRDPTGNVDWRVPRFHAISGSSPTVVLTHTKSEGRLDSHQLFLDYASSAVEETRWSVEERLLPPWLALKPTSGILPAGQAEGGLFVVSAAPNVPERIEPYRSSVHLTLTSDAFNATFVAVPILLIVAPATSAHHSMWGEAQLVTGSAGGGASAYRCDRHRQKMPLPSSVDVGVEQAVVFTACDSEGLRVSHSLPSEGLRVAHAIWKPEEVEEVRQHHGPQAWQVVLRDRASGQEGKTQYVYSSSGRYEATVAAPLVGEYELLLFLDWTHESARGERRLSENVPEGGGRWSREPVDTLYLVARCPPPLVPLPSRECGCPAGYEDHGYMACEPCAFGTHKPRPGNDACIPETWPVIVSTFGAFLGLVLLVVLLVYARRGWQRHLLASAAADRENACKQKRIRHAVLKVTTLEHPLAVMPLSRLRELGSLVSYEEARDAGALRCCDTVQSAVAFAVRHPLVFVSHQWLSLTHPDPESLHYPVILEAAEALCARQGLDPESLHIWLDYHSSALPPSVLPSPPHRPPPRPRQHRPPPRRRLPPQSLRRTRPPSGSRLARSRSAWPARTTLSCARPRRSTSARTRPRSSTRRPTCSAGGVGWSSGHSSLSTARSRCMCSRRHSPTSRSGGGGSRSR